MAKTLSCVFESSDQLNRFIREKIVGGYQHVLVQIFSGIIDEDKLENIQSSVKDSLPESTIIGCTTSGEIMDGQTLQEKIILSFTIFEETSLSAEIFQLSDYANSHEMGRSLGETLVSSDTKAILLFSSDFTVDVQDLLNGIYEQNPRVAITGGIAGDNGHYHQGLVFANGRFTNRGVVAVALNSESLRTETYVNHQWQEIGKSFNVTKSKGTTIYSIDGMKPLHLLQRYLGEDFVRTLPQSGVEFPFVLEGNGEPVSVFVTGLGNKGAIKVNRSVQEGDKLTFAYNNVKGMIGDSLKELKRLSKTGAETIFVYSCMARKRILRDFAEEEVRMLNTIASTNGFFSYGEIANKNDSVPQLVGHSLTYLALSENEHMKEVQFPSSFRYEIPDSMNTIVSLTKLMSASQEDIRVLNENVEISEQYYRSLFDNNTDFVYSTDLKGHFTSLNPAFEKTFGYTKDELLGKSALKFIEIEDIPRVRMHFYRALKGKEQYYTIEISSKSGVVCLFQIKNIPITVNGEAVGIYGLGRNISEQKKIEEKMLQLAYYDQDTGLPNRLKFTETLGDLLQRAKHKKRTLAVMVIDLDRFKNINDSLGYEAGDEIIKEISLRIGDCLPSGSYLGRFSGDKFNVAISKNANMDEVIKLAKQILEHISAPIAYSNQEFFVTASIGVSFYPSDGLDEVTLLKNADIAMNRSKQPGGNRITYYSNEMNEEAFLRLEFESYLRKALQKDEFYLCYQPLVDLASCKVFGTEALIRWNHPKLGLVSPGEFIPLAEETGLIEEIGSWVLRTACKQNKQWQQMGCQHLSVSVNVSASQFQQFGFVKEVESALRESQLDPQYLTLELTESTMLRNIEHSIDVMKDLQRLGVKVSIDDFGTGYSSLSYLKDLPINTLKIDRSFINNLRLDTSDIAIVKAIITMGHGLEMKVVAEGVETEEQIMLLKELKCHYAQGFYIHKPLTTDDFEKQLLKKSV
jgi:diguanylate cyclase (GGDEF)-like protein/PAS domain S-box-containing protein